MSDRATDDEIRQAAQMFDVARTLYALDLDEYQVRYALAYVGARVPAGLLQEAVTAAVSSGRVEVRW